MVAQGRRVLLAEDNLINQTVAKKMLTVLGLVCEVACNGQEAVDLARAGASDGRPFDVVLMDMAMPVMNGTEACRVWTAFTLSRRPRASSVVRTRLAHLLGAGGLGLPARAPQVRRLRRLPLRRSAHGHGRARHERHRGLPGLGRMRAVARS